MNTAQRLGYRPDERLLLINADDFGLCHSTNLGIQTLLAGGVVGSATVMMPCGWAREAVRWSSQHPNLNVGIHLALTSEWPAYRWGPITPPEFVSSLVTVEGFFPPDPGTVERNACPEHVRTELINQIELAKSWGLDPTHLDNHMGSLYGLATGRDFIRIVFDICATYRLPFRIPRRVPRGRGAVPDAELMAARLGELADAMGIVILDDLVQPPFQGLPGETYETFQADMIRLLKNLREGVTELILHPSLAGEDIKAFHPFWQKREWELRLFRDPDTRNLMEEEGIRLIRWSDLRALQRSQ